MQLNHFHVVLKDLRRIWKNCCVIQNHLLCKSPPTEVRNVSNVALAAHMSHKPER